MKAHAHMHAHANPARSTLPLFLDFLFICNQTYLSENMLFTTALACSHVYSYMHMHEWLDIITRKNRCRTHAIDINISVLFMGLLSIPRSILFFYTHRSIRRVRAEQRERVLGFCWHKAYLREHHCLLCAPADPEPFKWAWGLQFYGLNGVSSHGGDLKREVLRTTSKHFIFSSSTLRAFVSSPLHLLPSPSVGPPCLDAEKTRRKKTDREDAGASYLDLMAQSKLSGIITKIYMTVSSFCMLAFIVKEIDGFILRLHCVHV